MGRDSRAPRTQCKDPGLRLSCPGAANEAGTERTRCWEKRGEPGRAGGQHTGPGAPKERAGLLRLAEKPQKGRPVLLRCCVMDGRAQGQQGETGFHQSW